MSEKPSPQRFLCMQVSVSCLCIFLQRQQFSPAAEENNKTLVSEWVLRKSDKLSKDFDLSMTMKQWFLYVRTDFRICSGRLKLTTKDSSAEM